MDLKDITYVGMTDIASVTHLGRKPFGEARPGAFDSDAKIHLFIHGLPNDAHASTRDFADDSKAIQQQLSRHERSIVLPGWVEGIEQKATHAFFRLDIGP